MLINIAEYYKRMITINNSNYGGKNITIINGKVFIDGKDVTPEGKEINISVQGNIDSLEIDFATSIQVHGDVNKLRSGSANVKCTNITGGVQTGSGDVECTNIEGDVQTGSGDVEATTITGSVKTGSGDIKYKGK
jgi:hypothetical protein